MDGLYRLRPISLPPQYLQNSLKVRLHVHVLSFPTHGQPDHTAMPRRWLNAADAVGVYPCGPVGMRVGELNERDRHWRSPSTRLLGALPLSRSALLVRAGRADNTSISRGQLHSLHTHPHLPHSRPRDSLWDAYRASSHDRRGMRPQTFTDVPSTRKPLSLRLRLQAGADEPRPNVSEVQKDHPNPAQPCANSSKSCIKRASGPVPRLARSWMQTGRALGQSVSACKRSASLRRRCTA
jgi:hypothetical protein